MLGAGGVGRGRQLAAALALGCEGVWCGSIWLKTVESEVTPEIKAEDVRRALGRRGADAQRHRQAVPHAAQRLHRRVGPARRAGDAAGAAQALLWWGQGRTRVERVRAPDFLTYPVGQIVGDMTEETSVRNVVHDMLLELVESKERLDRLLDLGRAMLTIRSLFFAPANRPDLVTKFPRFAADCCVIDLEDGTPPADKASRARRPRAPRRRGAHASRWPAR